MRTLNKVLLGGVTVALIAGSAVAYAAAKPSVHHLTVMVPGIGVERIDYTGDVAPKVVLEPDAFGLDAAWPGFAAPFAQMDRFVSQMDRMAAQADRQMATTLARFQDMPLNSDGALNSAAFSNLPAGTQSYSFVSTMSGNNVCTRMIRVTSAGDGARPQVVSQSSGDCGAAGHALSQPSGVTQAALHATPAPLGARQSI